MADVAIIDEALEVYGMSLAQFCKHTGIPRATFDTWRSKGEVSEQGGLLLNTLIENKSLRDELRECRAFKESLRTFIGGQRE